VWDIENSLNLFCPEIKRGSAAPMTIFSLREIWRSHDKFFPCPAPNFVLVRGFGGKFFYKTKGPVILTWARKTTK